MLSNEFPLDKSPNPQATEHFIKSMEYKNYILAFMFYRYLSEHQERYLISENVIDIKDGQSINDAYKEQASGKDKDDYIEEMVYRIRKLAA